jgi:hypothetical protein
MRFLTPAEIIARPTPSGPSIGHWSLLAPYGGLRIGELAGLRRGCVDLLRGTARWPRS